MPYMTLMREPVLDTWMEGISFTIVHECKLIFTYCANGSFSRKWRTCPHFDGLAWWAIMVGQITHLNFFSSTHFPSKAPRVPLLTFGFFYLSFPAYFWLCQLPQIGIIWFSVLYIFPCDSCFFLSWQSFWFKSYSTSFFSSMTSRIEKKDCHLINLSD